MIFKPHQLTIAIAAGLITAGSVAYFTIRSHTEPLPLSSPPVRNSSPPEFVESPQSITPTPAPSPSPSTISVNPIQISPPTSGCPIQMAVVDDPAPPLNVRSTPEVLPDNVVGQLNNDTFLFVSEQQNGWLKIRNPIPGWVAQNRTRSSCANIVQPINFSRDRNQAIIQGEIIGSGSHRYTFEGQANQTLTVESRNAIFPQIITPDGQLIADDAAPVVDRQSWTGQLPTTGQYTLELNSNFRGFEYDFSVEID